jgi:peptidoglycan hydrolase CwlO-like protein
LSPALFTTFWYLSLPNLVVPEQFYKEEIKRINEQISNIQSKDPKNKKEIDKLTKLVKAIQTELDQQIVKRDLTLKHLTELLPKLFAGMKG